MLCSYGDLVVHNSTPCETCPGEDRQAITREVMNTGNTLLETFIYISSTCTHRTHVSSELRFEYSWLITFGGTRTINIFFQ